MGDKIIPNREKTQFRSGEEAETKGRLGGINSGKTRREQKQMKTIALKMLNSMLNDEQASKLNMFSLNKHDKTFTAAVISQQIVKALKGDTNAAKYLQEISGQKEPEKVESTVSVKAADLSDEDLAKRLEELNRKLEQ